MNFRSARLSDTAALVQFVNSAYRGDHSKKGWTTEADLLDGQRTDDGKIIEMINDPEASLELLFDETQKLVGCVYLKQEPSSVYLGMLTVEPALQGKGHGAQLIEHAKQWARKAGKTQMRMTVIQGREELIAYYQRKGWQLTGKQEPFPMDDPRFGIPKRPLLFLELTAPL